MSLAYYRLLRLGNRVLRRVLPAHQYQRVKRAVKAGLSEFEKGHAPILAPSETRDGGIAALLAPRVKRDALGAPAAFVALHGRPVETGDDLAQRLAAEAEECALVLCCAFTGRHQLVRHIVEESLAGSEAADVRWMLAGSSEEDMELIRRLARETGRVAGFAIDNRPLGRKWQTCVHLARRYYDAELYGITGSDDFVSNRLVGHIVRRHRQNRERTDNAAFLPAMYATLEWLICNVNASSPHAPQIIKCNYDYATAFQPLGAGRFYTRSFLDSRRALIFESNKERLLDDRGYFDLCDNGFHIEYYSLGDGPLVSVKGDWSQLNGIDAVLSAPTLNLREFSFEGHALLRGSLSAPAHAFLFGASEPTDRDAAVLRLRRRVGEHSLDDGRVLAKLQNARQVRAHLPSGGDGVPYAYNENCD